MQLFRLDIEIKGFLAKVSGIRIALDNYMELTRKCCQIFALLLALFGSLQASALEKSEALDKLKLIKTNNQNELIALDSKVSELLNRIHQLDPNRFNEQETEQFKRLEQAMGVFVAKRSEYLLRQEFFDRLIFVTENKFNGGDYKSFLETELKKMSATDLQNVNYNRSLWKFLSYLSIAIKNLSEKNEDLFAFMVGYIEFSSVSNPIRPDEFISQRDYTDGVNSLNVEDKKRTDVGELVDEKIRQLQRQEEEQIRQKLQQQQLPAPQGQFAITVEVKTAIDPEAVQQDLKADLEKKWEVLREHQLKEEPLQSTEALAPTEFDVQLRPKPLPADENL